MSENEARRASTTRVVPNSKSVNYSSFSLMDGFRRDMARMGMGQHTIEKHVKASQGKGYDHQYAYFKMVKGAYERGDKEYV